MFLNIVDPPEAKWYSDQLTCQVLKATVRSLSNNTYKQYKKFKLFKYIRSSFKLNGFQLSI